MNHKVQFLKAVLGDDGASALQKAAERSQAIENALVPRAILAWIGIAARSEHKGKLPGLDNTFVEFRKSESGYSGQIAVGDDVYEFTNQSLYHLAASVAVSMGVDHERVPSNIRDKDLANLGKSIDLLVKARVVTENYLKKAEAPGPAAPPVEAAGPLEAQAPTKQQGAPARPPKAKPKLPKLPKQPASVTLPKLKLSEAQLRKTCESCATSHVDKTGRFVGCLCWRALAKSTTLAKNTDGTFTMSFSTRAWDREAFEAFVSDMQVRR
jgi:hypothetical protein